MYASFFGLKHEPFSIAPDPRYLFMSERHREALAHLLYGVGGGGGFVLLTGEIGAGKTTVCRCFLEQIPRRCNVAYIFNPKLTVIELLTTVCDEFHIPQPAPRPEAATVKHYIDPLNDYLLKTHAVGQNNVLIIDEAQNLSADVIEQLRLLTNLETSERKLLQIVLIGQPELRTMLAQSELEQVAQRVVARFHLDALSPAETAQYIAHRLAVAGMSTPNPFDEAAMERIHSLARGVPRRINLLCDRAMLGAYAGGRQRIGRDIVDKAAAEVFGTGDASPPAVAVRAQPAHWVLLGLGGGLAVGAIAWAALAPGGDAAAGRTAAATAPASAASAPAAASSAASTVLAASGVTAPAASSRAAAAASSEAPASAIDPKTAFRSPIASEREAWRELAPLWKLTLDADSDPCATAPRQQVHCFKGSGSGLALIRQLGRPGIVVLRVDGGATAYALLTGLGADTASLRMNGVVRTVPLATLAEAWRGDFWTYWRSPPGYASRAVDGEPGPLADWVATQLAKLQPASGRASEVTPSALRSDISAFQLAQGLKADGIAGPTTFMQLNRALGIDEPRLSAKN